MRSKSLPTQYIHVLFVSISTHQLRRKFDLHFLELFYDLTSLKPDDFYACAIIELKNPCIYAHEQISTLFWSSSTLYKPQTRILVDSWADQLVLCILICTIGMRVSRKMPSYRSRWRRPNGFLVILNWHLENRIDFMIAYQVEVCNYQKRKWLTKILICHFSR